ncbi:MAG: phytanoyl-CoA dioxygenase family protein, partial [Phycisphaeraceae bacterium]
MSSTTPTATPALPSQPDESQRYRVSVEQYVTFRRDGFVIVRGLVPPEDIAELRQHTDDLMLGRLPEQHEMEEFRGTEESSVLDQDQREQSVKTVRHLMRPPDHLSPEEKAQYFLRIHMLHRQLELHERYMLHPRVLDVLEVLIGPDVLALQTMLFLKPPGKPGQGWHQDSYYIPTQPDSLCGAWIAIDDADEQNGAMWFAKGSGNEPVYPPCPEVKYGFGDTLVHDVKWVKGVSDTDDEQNDLAKVADRYDQVLGTVKAGDVVFFNGHVLHRSKQNWSQDRFRRAFVSHYCNARSYTQWGADTDADGNKIQDPETGATNGSHILARGDTHLPFAKPRFGTPCAALQPAEQRRQHTEYITRIIASMNDGLMG